MEKEKDEMKIIKVGINEGSIQDEDSGEES